MNNAAKMDDEERSVLMKKSRAFAKRIATMVDYLEKNRNRLSMPIYSQILRSGTAVMANVSESHFAQSSSDFVSKFQIALKKRQARREVG